MEFGDCLIYNFFNSSPLKNDWRVLYNTSSTSSEARPPFDTKRHNALCVELKILYVLITRTRQNLIFYDEDVLSRSPMLDCWLEKGLVEARPLDEDIRGMFRSQASSPDDWAKRFVMSTSVCIYIATKCLFTVSVLEGGNCLSATSSPTPVCASSAPAWRARSGCARQRSSSRRVIEAR